MNPRISHSPPTRVSASPRLRVSASPRLCVPASPCPRAPGTYALLIQVTAPVEITPGRPGPFRLEPGWYVYVGSALGPGGLAARVGRHLRPAGEKRPRWHIDYLTAQVPVSQVVWAVGDERRECQWARWLLALPGASAPIPRFGASDCDCPAHLIRLAEAEGSDTVLTCLRSWHHCVCQATLNELELC
jgi:Uri superfamily endonuclease